MKLIIGSDKSGFPLKESIKSYLVENNIAFTEVGTLDPVLPTPFFELAPIAAKAIQKGKADMAILVCGTGMGVAQVANCYKGVRAAAVESVYTAKMCRAVNDSNVLCMGGWVIAPEMGIEMTKVFLQTGFTEGLEEWRQEFLQKAKTKFDALEDEIYTANGI